MTTTEITNYIKNKITLHFTNSNETFIDILSGDIQKRLNLKDVTPQVCKGMQYVAKTYPHQIISTPNKGMGTTLKIRYYKDAAAFSTAEKIETIVGQPKISRNNNTSTIEVAELDIDYALKSIRKYHNTTNNDEHTRYRSWEHCYRAFLENRHNSEKAEYLSLHLACYLASWGMLRNSFLLNFDYLIHLPVVRILTSKRFEILFENPSEQNIKIVMEAKEEIKKGYNRSEAITDTLVTKILLGVFGCTPAYDRYFKNAAIKYKICSGGFNENSLIELWEYYVSNRDKFEMIRCELDLGRLSYPPMKLLDMCLWQIGYDEDPEKQYDE